MIPRTQRFQTKTLGAFAALLTLCACESKSERHVGPKPGFEQGPCFSDQTCYAGLFCLSGLCVCVPDADLMVDADADTAIDQMIGVDDGSDAGDQVTIDGGSIDAADFGDATGEDSISMTTASVEIGTGLYGFEPVAERQVMYFFFDMFEGTGRYESFFIRFSLRARNIDPRFVHVAYVLLDGGTGAVLAASEPQTFDLAPNNTGGFELLGSAPRIADCCAALDAPLIMRVDLTD